MFLFVLRFEGVDVDDAVIVGDDGVVDGGARVAAAAVAVLLLLAFVTVEATALDAVLPMMCVDVVVSTRADARVASSCLSASDNVGQGKGEGDARAGAARVR